MLCKEVIMNFLKNIKNIQQHINIYKKEMRNI